MYRSWGKRLIDVALSCLLILVLSPVLVIISLVVLIDLGRPILFVQVRPGLNSEPFRLYKFRTMKTLDPSDPAHDGMRVTAFGKLLRSLSLDELPELFNVLKGNMSLVGPRPLLMEYLSLYSPEQAERHLARPGLTGLAQVQGRNALSWREKFSFDCSYVHSYSIGLDFQILIKTVAVVLTREGINSPGHDSSLPFEG